MREPMYNYELFKKIFGLYATELWAKPEKEFLEWLNAKAEKEVKPIVYCKDCKWWKESDGTYRRDVYAESRCPMNTETVYKGEGYCYMAEPKESEEEE